jgi:hypothetical protein
MSGQGGTAEDFVKELIQLRRQMSGLRDIAARYSAAEEALRSQESCLEALATLNAMGFEPAQSIARYALEEAVRLTESEAGWMGLLSDDESRLVMYLWSHGASAQCEMKEPPHAFVVREGGIWSWPVASRKPLIVNDYTASHPGKKGYPPGHMTLRRLMSVPAFSGSRVAAIVVVGNRKSDYGPLELRKLSLIIDFALGIIQRKRMEASLSSADAQSRLLLDLVGQGFYSMNLVALAEIEMAIEALGQQGGAARDSLYLLEKPRETLNNSIGLIDRIKSAYAEGGGLRLAEVDLGHVLSGVVQSYTAAYGHDVSISFTPAPGLCVKANELLEVVFSSLIETAIARSDPGQPASIRVEVTKVTEQYRDYLVTAVEAAGPGRCLRREPGAAPCEVADACRGGPRFALIRTIVGHFDGRIWVENLGRDDGPAGCRAVVMLPAC